MKTKKRRKLYHVDKHVNAADVREALRLCEQPSTYIHSALSNLDDAIAGLESSEVVEPSLDELKRFNRSELLHWCEEAELDAVIPKIHKLNKKALIPVILAYCVGRDEVYEVYSE